MPHKGKSNCGYSIDVYRDWHALAGISQFRHALFGGMEWHMGILDAPLFEEGIFIIYFFMILLLLVFFKST